MTKNQRTPSKGGIRIKCTMLLILHGNEVKKNLLQSDGVIICLFKNGLSKLGSLANCWLETWLQVQHEVHLSRTQTRNKTGICFISSVLTIFRYQAMASVWLTLPVVKSCYMWIAQFPPKRILRSAAIEWEMNPTNFGQKWAASSRSSHGMEKCLLST